MNHPGKCRNLHGHSVKASITIQAEQLNEQGMVCDFSDIKECAKKFIDQQLDHNFLLHKDDAIIPLLKQQHERFLALDEHPTAEILAKMIFQNLKNTGFQVDNVTLWETESASACYREDSTLL